MLIENDREKHDAIVIDTIKKVAEINDVIVLAQGSMFHLMPLLKDIKVPVLTSLETEVAQIRKTLNLD